MRAFLLVRAAQGCAGLAGEVVHPQAWEGGKKLFGMLNVGRNLSISLQEGR